MSFKQTRVGIARTTHMHTDCIPPLRLRKLHSLLDRLLYAHTCSLTPACTGRQLVGGLAEFHGLSNCTRVQQKASEEGEGKQAEGADSKQQQTDAEEDNGDTFDDEVVITVFLRARQSEASSESASPPPSMPQVREQTTRMS